MRAVIRTVAILARLINDIKIFGASKLDKDARMTQMIEKLLNKNSKTKDLKQPLPWHLLHPESPFKTIWNIVILFLLIYTVTFMSFQIAFMETEDSIAWFIFDLIIDSLFLIDVGVNLLSSYYKEDGELEFSHKVVAWKYMKNWMFLDLLACTPTNLIEIALGSDSDEDQLGYNSLLRLLRLPRLYRLIRIVRIFKIVKVFKNSRWV